MRHAFNLALREWEGCRTLVQKRINLYGVQLLGHKDRDMAQRYAPHCPDSLRDGVRVLEKPLAIDTNLSQHVPMTEGQACNLLNRW